MAIELLTLYETDHCTCGKVHRFASDVRIGNGVVRELPQILKTWGARKAFLIADAITNQVAAEQVRALLKADGIATADCVFREEHPEPDEHSVGYALMYFQTDCDVIIGVGSGVINDIGKLVAKASGKPYIIIATAPSMDGYASPSSSMERAGLKTSLPSKCPEVIIGDLDFLSQAPMKMLISGLGDMLAKYVGLCEWRIAHIITGEYYCDTVAEVVRAALKKCMDNAEGLLSRDSKAVSAVFEGLIICGAAMAYAESTRPASGGEHYLSHVWDMRGAVFGTPTDLHGIQCAVGTLITVKAYEQLFNIPFDAEKASRYVNAFDYEAWCAQLRSFLGAAAEPMIMLERREKKYDKTTHAARLARILENREEIAQIIQDELPRSERLLDLYKQLGMPVSVTELGLDKNILPLTFSATRDIRDKYVLSRLCWDLGITPEEVLDND